MQDPKTYLKTLLLIYVALIVGQVAFAVVTLIMSNEPQLILQANDDVLFFIVPGLALVCLMASTFLFKKLIANTKAQSTLSDKLNNYRSILIIRYALLEGPSLFGIVAFFLSGNLYYLIISALIILFFLTLRPTREKLETDLNLDYKEKEAFAKMLQ